MSNYVFPTEEFEECLATPGRKERAAYLLDRLYEHQPGRLVEVALQSEGLVKHPDLFLTLVDVATRSETIEFQGSENIQGAFDRVLEFVERGHVFQGSNKIPAVLAKLVCAGARHDAIALAPDLNGDAAVIASYVSSAMARRDDDHDSVANTPGLG